MAQPAHGGELRDPIHRLAYKPFCDPPPDDLSVEQLYALHEFFHTVMAAGYKLYQTVPADAAARVIHDKFSYMLGLPPADPNA
jgi:hypothetical protein